MVEKKDKLKKGAKQAIKTCLAVKGKEHVIIITDKKTKKITKHFEQVSLDITDNVETLIIENFSKRPVTKTPKKILNKVKKSDVALFLVQKSGNEVPFRRRVKHCALDNKVRFVNMPGITKEVVDQGLNTNHKNIWKLTKKLHQILGKSKNLHVKSKNGTDLYIRLNPDYNWVIADGDLRKSNNKGTNLPGGEIYTCPKNVNGVAVIDGALGDIFTEKYGLLKKNPLTLYIEGGYIKDIKSKNSKLIKEFNKYMDSTNNGRRIGEVALGTNMEIKKPIGIMLQDEKLPTFHLAVGNPYPNLTNAPWQSKVHCDGIIQNATVFVDNKKILEKGKYLI